MKKTFEYKQPVYFSDVDMGGVLYHARYFDYCDRARQGALAELGFSFRDMLSMNVGIAVAGAKVSFKRPVYFGDEVLIRSRLKEMSGAVFVIHQEVFESLEVSNYENPRPRSHLEVQLVFIDLTSKKKTSIPADLLPKFESLMGLVTDEVET